MLVTSLDETAWLLNLRGSDVPLNPVALAYTVVRPDTVELFVHEDRVTPHLRAALPTEVGLRPYDEIAACLRALPADTALLVNPAKTNALLHDATSHLQRVEAPSPVDAMKAKKNEVELRGAAVAYRRDGVALTRLLHWLATTDVSRENELSVSDKLEYFRSDLDDYRGPGFETIVGYGPNSSVGHYKLNRDNPQGLAPDSLLLIDCGAQFPQGTTDTTRTVTLGRPTPEHRQTYTTVLKSLIMLSSATFPTGTTGKRLDALGRFHIWSNGWECRHGIGHGVGSYLHVHEGPQRINKTNEVAFEVGHVNSNEPGVYFEGEFGVRLENVIATVPAGSGVFGEFLRFETLTLCPFDPRLIDVSALTVHEIEWLDSYHQRVVEELGPLLPDDVKEWLVRTTGGIGGSPNHG
jgi:Xaa-Pro aminopeptidase